jgi:hypothetical protein
MAHQDDVRRIALALPDTREADGHFSFSVVKAIMARISPSGPARKYVDGSRDQPACSVTRSSRRQSPRAGDRTATKASVSHTETITPTTASASRSCRIGESLLAATIFEDLPAEMSEDAAATVGDDLVVGSTLIGTSRSKNLRDLRDRRLAAVDDGLAPSSAAPAGGIPGSPEAHHGHQGRGPVGGSSSRGNSPS